MKGFTPGLKWIKEAHMKDDARLADTTEFNELLARESALLHMVEDMYEALEGLLNALPSATTHPAIKAARAALAKAKPPEPEMRIGADSDRD